MYIELFEVMKIQWMDWRQKILQDGCRIVEIDLNKLPSNVNIYDLSTAVDRNTYLKGVTAKNFEAKSSEVLLASQM